MGGVTAKIITSLILDFLFYQRSTWSRGFAFSQWCKFTSEFTKVEMCEGNIQIYFASVSETTNLSVINTFLKSDDKSDNDKSDGKDEMTKTSSTIKNDWDVYKDDDA